MEIEKLKILAQKAEPSSKVFYKKNARKLEKSDHLVYELHNKIMNNTNCLDCANCCRSLGPLITNKDIERISKTLHMKPGEFIEKYLIIDEDNDYVFKTMPCPFLMDDNYCSIYPSRPKACQEYPHTDRPKFYQIFKTTIKNTYTCPVAYKVIEELKNNL